MTCTVLQTNGLPLLSWPSHFLRLIPSPSLLILLAYTTSYRTKGVQWRIEDCSS